MYKNIVFTPKYFTHFIPYCGFTLREVILNQFQKNALFNTITMNVDQSNPYSFSKESFQHMFKVIT